MQIQAKNDRDAGKRILCNGTVYQVNSKRELCLLGETSPAEVPEADAAKLLQNSAWEPLGTQRQGAPGRRAGRIRLVDSRGGIVTPPEPEKPAEAPPGPTVDVSSKGSEVAETPAEPADGPGMDASPSPVAEPVEVEDPPIPVAEGEEWADPKPNYSLTWLRKCARAYDVGYGPRTSAQLLCERITAAMYEGSEGSES